MDHQLMILGWQDFWDWPLASYFLAATNHSIGDVSTSHSDSSYLYLLLHQTYFMRAYQLIIRHWRPYIWFSLNMICLITSSLPIPRDDAHSSCFHIKRLYNLYVWDNSPKHCWTRWQPFNLLGAINIFFFSLSRWRLFGRIYFLSSWAC